MEVRFHPEALAELIGAMTWYGDRSERAKAAFLDEFELAVSRMREAPLRWPTYQHGTRTVRLRRFPFAVVGSPVERLRTLSCGPKGRQLLRLAAHPLGERCR